MVRTYPTPSKTHVEVSCTAGVTREGQWLRLFPIPYRLLDPEQWFAKYQWVRVAVRKAPDRRDESYIIDRNSLEVVSDVMPTTDGWRERRELTLRDMPHCMCCLRDARDKHKKPTLAVIRPKTIKRLHIVPTETAWSEEELASLRREQDQGGFFKTARIAELPPAPGWRGFNISPLGPAGEVLEHWCNQDELRWALNRWLEPEAARPRLGPAEPV